MKIKWLLAKSEQFIRSRFSTVVIFFLILLFALARCRVAFATGQYGVTSQMGFAEARKTLGGLDAGSYIQGAISLVDGSYRSSANDFIWELWPPGLSIVESATITIFGLAAKPLLVLAVSSSILVALATTLLWRYALKNRMRSATVLLLGFLLFSSVTQGWLLDQGIMYAEGFFLFFSICSLIVLATYRSNRVYHLISAGALLGFAAYFRAVGFTVIQLILGVGVAFFCASILLLSKKKFRIIAHKGFDESKKFIVIGFIALCVTLPWSLFRGSWLKINPLQWVITSNATWQAVWLSDKKLQESGWGITKGIDNWACHLDQARCANFADPQGKTINFFWETLCVVLKHPIKFLEMRISVAWEYWKLNGRWLYPPQSKIPAAIELTEGILFLGILIIAIVVMVRTFKSARLLVEIEIFALAGSTLPLLAYHLESRYFIPAKIFSVVIIILNYPYLEDKFKLERIRLNASKILLWKK